MCPQCSPRRSPGRKNGQTLVVREGDVAVAYKWSVKEYNWEKVGRAVLCAVQAEQAESRLAPWR